MAFFLSCNLSHCCNVQKSKFLGEPLQRVPHPLDLVWGRLLISQRVQEVPDIGLGPWDGGKPELVEIFKAQAINTKGSETCVTQKSINSRSWLGPLTAAMDGILSAKGAKRAISFMAHRSRSSCSGAGWSPVSPLGDGCGDYDGRDPICPGSSVLDGV